MYGLNYLHPTNIIHVKRKQLTIKYLQIPNLLIHTYCGFYNHKHTSIKISQINLTEMWNYLVESELPQHHGKRARAAKAGSEFTQRPRTWMDGIISWLTLNKLENLSYGSLNQIAARKLFALVRQQTSNGAN